MSWTKNMIKLQLTNMGFKGDEAIMMHSSMKAMGDVEGGADTVVDALMEFFEEGLLMMPTHTWKQMSETYNVFDPDTEPGCVGIIPNIFMKRPGVVRSLHPTHSIAAYGKNAAEYVKGEENVSTPCAPGGVWDRLRQVDARILLVGVTHARNTYIHSIEEMWDVPERFTQKAYDFQVKMPDGSLKDVKMYRHYNSKMAHISEAFDKMMEGYYETGAARLEQLGSAKTIVCRAAGLYEVTGRILDKEINCFIDRENIPKEWFM